MPVQRDRTCLVKRFVAALLVACSTAALSFADSNGTLNQNLDALRKIRGRLTFAVLGDCRGGDNYARIVRRAMEYRPDFVVNTGDMLESPERSAWVDFRKKSKPITVPYFLTVGNHDVQDEKSEALYKDETDLPGNELYYSFAAGSSLFVFLDSNIPGQERRITGLQYAWLEKLLSTSGHVRKFVFVHHPLFPDRRNGHHYGGSLDKYPAERDRLEALFRKHKVEAVFVGHEHLYSKRVVDGVVHIITGGGGAKLYADDDKGGFYHFILISVEGNEVKGKVIDIDGRVRDSFQF